MDHHSHSHTHTHRATPSSSSSSAPGRSTPVVPQPFFPPPSVREIHKNAWLKVLLEPSSSAPPSVPHHIKGLASIISSSSSNPPSSCWDKAWILFCVHDDVDPFLELYTDPKSAQSHTPMNAINLRTTLHVSPSLSGQPEVAITTQAGVVRLLTRNWEQMTEWLESLGGKLREMNILAPKDNLYSKPPERGVNGKRDPNSPLPLPPSSSHNGPFWASQDEALPPPNEEEEEELEEVYEPLVEVTAGASRNNSLPPGPVIQNVSAQRKRVPPSLEGTSMEHQLSSHRGFIPPSQHDTSSSHDGLHQMSQETVGEPIDCMLGLDSHGEYRIRSGEPPIYHTDSSVAAPLPLKEAQVLRLQGEMCHAAGVRTVLRKKDLTESIALVDFQGAVWVAGWKQRQHPVLYYAFHVGDRLLRVAGVSVNSSQEAQRAIRIAASLHIELVLRRVPLGRVWVLKREREGEPLGLVAEGGSGQISDVIEGGLAWRSGMRPSPVGGSNWYLTEINHRPLSLFSKDNQVKDRLNAVGREISILVQPTDLVLQLKRGLKGMKGSWKDYVVG